MSKLAMTYAQALYSLGAQENLQQEMLEQLSVLQEIFSQQPEYVRLLSSHSVPKQERCGLLQESIGGKVHPYVLNFMKILTQKDYIRYFSDCCKAFSRLYDEEHGILPVQAVTAVEMTAGQQERLQQKLAGITGKSIRLTNKVDPRCLGGVRLIYDGKLVEGTVAGRLDAIRDSLMHTAL